MTLNKDSELHKKFMALIEKEKERNCKHKDRQSHIPSCPNFKKKGENNEQ